jgi:hypothetical protein
VYKTKQNKHCRKCSWRPRPYPGPSAGKTPVEPAPLQEMLLGPRSHCRKCSWDPAPLQEMLLETPARRKNNCVAGPTARNAPVEQVPLQEQILWTYSSYCKRCSRDGVLDPTWDPIMVPGTMGGPSLSPSWPMGGPSMEREREREREREHHGRN